MRKYIVLTESLSTIYWNSSSLISKTPGAYSASGNLKSMLSTSSIQYLMLFENSAPSISSCTGLLCSFPSVSLLENVIFQLPPSANMKSSSFFSITPKDFCRSTWATASMVTKKMTNDARTILTIYLFIAPSLLFYTPLPLQDMHPEQNVPKRLSSQE